MAEIGKHLKTIFQDRIIEGSEIVTPVRWSDVLKAGAGKMMAIPAHVSYDAAYAAIEDLERRRQETLHMWPGCDQCKIVFPAVVPSPEDMHTQVLSAPGLADRTCEHNADPQKTLTFHIQWTEIVLLSSEITDACKSKVNEVRLVRRPGTRRVT